MRKYLIALAALSLVACDSGDVPSPADRMGGGPIPQTVDVSLVALHSQGLVAGPEAFFFAAGQSEVTTALGNVLGEAEETGTNEECGAGPMEYARFPGGLTVNFQSGSLAGWYSDASAQNIQIDSDVSIGMDRASLEAIPGYSPIVDSTLGEEFVISGEVAGFVEDDAVTMIYAGVQCFFR